MLKKTKIPVLNSISVFNFPKRCAILNDMNIKIMLPQNDSYLFVVDITYI